MAIQTVLDKNAPYGQLYGEIHNCAMYVQNGIEFDAKGNRVTPITLAEKEADEAEKAAKKAQALAKEAFREANEELSVAQRIEAEEAEKKKITFRNPEMPDFSDWTKKDMINHARNRFGVTVDSKKTHASIKSQLEELYGE